MYPDGMLSSAQFRDFEQRSDFSKLITEPAWNINDSGDRRH